MYNISKYIVAQELDPENILLYSTLSTSIITLEKVRGEVLFEIIKQFRAEGIDFAFPSQTVYMAK